jgi:hypothetical protein
MLEKIKEDLKKLFENCHYDTSLKEACEPAIEYIYNTPDGKVFNIKYEPEEKEFHVFDKDKKELDIFDDQTVGENGPIPSQLRKAIADDFMKNHSATEPVAESQPSTPKVGQVQPSSVPTDAALKPEKVVTPLEENKPVGNFTNYCK